MQRKTITIDDELYSALQRIRSVMIAAGKNTSFTGTVEVVLLNGILNAEKMNKDVWREIDEFQKQQAEIEREIEEHTKKMMEKIRKLMEMPL